MTFSLSLSCVVTFRSNLEGHNAPIMLSAAVIAGYFEPTLMAFAEAFKALASQFFPTLGKSGKFPTQVTIMAVFTEFAFQSSFLLFKCNLALEDEPLYVEDI